MKRNFINIFILILMFVQKILSQQFSTGSPEWLVDMFFSKDSFPDKANYYSGEMLKDINDLTIGEELTGNGEISFHQMDASNNKIIYSVQVSRDHSIIDFYCFLIKEGSNWKIEAVRRFLLPAFIYNVRDSLAQINVLSSDDSVFFLSVKLFTSEDNELKKYLKEHLNKFQELISLFISNSKNQADKILTSVGCNAIYSDNKYPGCIFIQILKFETMEVGFINAADIVLLPEISVEEYIYIEEVVPGWFIFRVM